MSSPILLAIDQGTTGTRAVVYDAATFRELGTAAKEIGQHYPKPGWVEHDANEIWSSVAEVVPARARQGRRRAEAHRRHRHHESARNGCPMGASHRQAGGPGHRLAGPPHQPTSAREHAGDQRVAARTDRAGARSLLLRRPKSAGCWRTIPALRARAEPASSLAGPSTPG